MYIKINLLGERQKKGGKAILWLSFYTICLFAFGVAALIQLASVNTALSDNESQVSLLEAQLAKLKVVTNEVRELSSKKQSLNEKIAVMAALRKKKAGPVRVMDDLNLSVPDKSWISDIKEAEGGMLKISGFALDNQTIAGFMKSLEASDYFSNVDLVETKQALVKGVGIKEFILQSKINYLGKLIPDQTAITLPEAELKVPEVGGVVAETATKLPEASSPASAAEITK